jgi:hypothetical protein
MICFSTIYRSYVEKHRSEATKKYAKAYHIIHSLCRFTHLESITIRFSILCFSVIYYDFENTLGGNLTGFRTFRE